MDGLPGLRRGYATAEKDQIKPIKKMVGPLAKEPVIPGKRARSEATLSINHVILAVIMAFLAGMAVVGVAAVEMGWIGGVGTGKGWEGVLEGKRVI